MHCAHGNTKNLAGLFSGKPSKETQFDKLSPSIIDLGQFDQRLIESQYIGAALRRLIRLGERDQESRATAFLSPSADCLVHKDAPHYFGGHGIEMRSVLPFHGIPADKADKSLIDQSSWL